MFSILLSVGTLTAQLTVEELNHLLDTQPFFGFRVDYNANLTLPDSVKQKFLIALSGRLTPHLQDSLFTFPPAERERLLALAKERCNGDDACIEKTFQEIIAGITERRNHFFENEPISGQLVLASGSWNIREAIPILENAIGNDRYGQRVILMALARLGNDSIKQALIDKYTLSYVLRTTELDTINDNNSFQKNNFTGRFFDEGMHTAMYLRNRDIMLNLLDLIYLRGRDEVQGAGTPRILEQFLWSLSMPRHFFHFPNREALQDITNDYLFAIWELDRRQRNRRQPNRRDQMELDRLLSTEHRTKVKNQIRDWIIENVNFE